LEGSETESQSGLKIMLMGMTEEIEQIQQVNPEKFYQQDKAAIDMQIAAAKAYPRSIQRSIENAIVLITLDEECAKTLTYAIPKHGKPITGPSVHLAKILAQTWGNLRIDAKVASIDKEYSTSEAICFDLESNLAIKASIKKSIIGPYGRYFDDMITSIGNAANSIALRNAILSVIPKPVVDKAYNAVKRVITGDVSTPEKLIAKRNEVLEYLKISFDVAESEILAAIGKKSIEFIKADDLVILIGIGQAIRDGDTTVEQAFNRVKKKSNLISIDDLTRMLEEKKSKLSKKELANANRIISANEENSFEKLHVQLTGK
jgi:hypothetical protein